jgi:LytS/YehU family sensor histidine kinase
MPDPENTSIPPMLLQPLIENSIRHARLHLVRNPEIELSFKKEGETLVISLKDNGMGRENSTRAHESKALSILERRVSEINVREGKHFSAPLRMIDLKDKKGGAAGTECLIKLPYLEVI